MTVHFVGDWSMREVLEILFVLGSIIWAISPIFGGIMLNAFRRLQDLTFPEPEKYPGLSIIIAACNEEDTIEDALRTILKQDYPKLEIIAVNDRSTDKTGEILKKLAAEDSRLVDIHLDTLPEGWLGKVHAMHHATLRASGDWILFTDADVHFHGDILRRVIGVGESENLDHIALFPKLKSRSFFARCAISTAIRAICISLKPWHIRNPDRPESLGAGAFNLVRRTHFEKTPGFEWLRLEVADDIGLAQMMKAHGGRADLFVAIESVSVEWYSSLKSLFLGLEKNGFAQLARFSLFRGVLISLLVMCISISPFALIFLASNNVFLTIAGLAFVGAAWTGFQINRLSGDSWLMVFASFLVGDFILGLVLLRSTVLGFLRGGVIWRGTVYSKKELKTGVRVKM